jgi:glycosyltransferase involved in cell wall biosynthesis
LDGIPELIDDDIGGILTTPGSVEELSKAIIFSIGNEFKMAKMSDYSYKKYWESFSRQAQFQRYRNLIKNDFI